MNLGSLLKVKTKVKGLTNNNEGFYFTDCFRKRAGTVIGIAANLSVLISVMLYPFMPAASAEIRRQCNIKLPLKLPTHFIQFLPTGWTTIEVNFHF